VRSALFAVHRRLMATRSIVKLVEEDDSTAMRRALASAATSVCAICAIPVLNQHKRLVAEFVLVSEQADRFAEIPVFLLEELARMTATALDNALRLSHARRDQERLLLLAEAAEEALWDWNLMSEVIWWGAGIHNLLGSSNEENRHLPSSKFEYVRPEDAERVRHSFQRALESVASSWLDEYEILRADGTQITVEDRAFFLRAADGQAYRVIGAMRDITQLKRLLVGEQQARAEAEAASRAKDEFLAMLGHELRNPLAPIVTAIELMKQRGVREGERERTIIERQAKHLVRLVDDLLDVSRITRGMIDLQREPIALSDVLAMGIDMARPLIEQRGHVLEVQVAPTGLTIRVDPARFAQVISNLLNNAARYTDPGGRITITGQREGSDVCLTVRDTGIGIAPDMLHRVFDLFAQERQDVARSRGGLGLGLSIVRTLVNLHGGSVDVHSEGRGRGSVFTVRVPSADTAVHTVLPPRESERPGDATVVRRILVVDDNQDAAELLSMYLGRLGHDVQVAGDGLEALERAAQFQPDIAILDIGLPVMDGYELARRLRDRFPAHPLVLIALTGYGQPSDRARAHEAGFDIHLVKPVGKAALDEALRLARPTPAACGSDHHGSH
jgi:PAS domain S-box-containing protein